MNRNSGRYLPAMYFAAIDCARRALHAVCNPSAQAPRGPLAANKESVVKRVSKTGANQPKEYATPTVTPLGVIAALTMESGGGMMVMM